MVHSGNGKESKDSSSHPFAKKDPKPTRARLVSLLDPLGRKRYSEVERFLATIQGATSGLFYYPNAWGWAVRYLIGTKNTLCTLHLLPSLFEASVQLGKEIETLLKAAPLDADLKRRLARSKIHGGVKCVRMPVKNDHDYASFKTLIQYKAESLRIKKPVKSPKIADEASSTGEKTSAAKKTAAKSTKPSKATPGTSVSKSAPAKKSAAAQPEKKSTKKSTVANKKRPVAKITSKSDLKNR